MGYSAVNFQWRFTLKGKAFQTTCGKLGLPRDQWTKRASENAAKAWQEQILAIELPKIDKANRVQRALNELGESELAQLFIDASRQKHLVNLARKGELTKEAIEEFPIERNPTFETVIKPETSLGDHKKQYLALQATRLKANSYKEVKAYIDTLEILDLKTVYHQLAESKISAGARKKRFGFFKRFLTYLAEEGVIELPRNFASKLYKFNVKPTVVAEFTITKSTLDGLPEKLRLYALLALNCSMNNVDIGQLAKSQIRNGYLTRKRVKTETGPTVSYKLWPVTIALLEKFRSDHAELMLTSETGTPLWDYRIENGLTKSKDLIYLHWRKHANCPLTLKNFRTFGATMIETIDARFTSHYLGHSPKSIAERHYVAPNQQLFDKALDKLWFSLRG